MPITPSAANLESSLALSVHDILNELGAYIGFGFETDRGVDIDSENLSTWTDSQFRKVLRSCNGGLAQFYVPPTIPGQVVPHEWSFLKPETSVRLWTDVEDLTVSGIPGGVNDYKISVNAADGDFYPSMVGHTATLTGSTASPAITSAAIVHWQSARHVYLDEAAKIVSGTFSLAANGRYRLPADFGGLIGDGYYQVGEGPYQPVKQIGTEQIRRMLQESDSQARPRYMALVPVHREERDRSTVSPAIADLHDWGQRFDLVVSPIPETDHDLYIRYQVLPEALAIPADGVLLSGRRYPWGGAAHSETILASCMAAAARMYVQAEAAERWAHYMVLLQGSVERDRQMESGEMLGVMTDPSARLEELQWTRHNQDHEVTAYGS